MMKRNLMFSLSAFLVLFVILYVILTALGIGSGKLFTGSDNVTGRLLKDLTSNPAIKGMENSIILQTGPATSNPYLVVEVKSSADCVKCHFDPSINFASSEHMKGSIKLADIQKYDDGSCKKCHDIKAVDNATSDSAVLLNGIYKFLKPQAGGEELVITCIGCHGTNNGTHYTKLNFKTDDCASCHDKPDNCLGVSKNPIAGNITSNFKASAHFASVTTEKFLEKAKKEGLLQNMNGTEFFVNSIKCLSCHQNASFKKYFAESSYYMGADGSKHYESFNDNNTQAFLDSGVGSGLSGLTLLNDKDSDAGLLCATCHDVHSGSLTRKDVFVSHDSRRESLKNADGKVLETPVKVFSAEFNLCSKCHDVKLDYTWDSKALRFDYALSKSAHDNATNVKDPTDLAQRAAKIIDGKVDITNANPFLYGNLQSEHLKYEGGLERPTFQNDPLRKILNTSETIIDTHFKGTIVLETVEYDGTDYILKRETVKGYNINASSPRACTSCHDSHAGVKFGVKDTPDMIKDFKFTADGFDGGSLQTARINKDIIALTESWADSDHGNYKSESFLQDDFEARCMQCHSGYEAAKFMTGKIALDKLDNITTYSSGLGGEVASCVTCHDLAEKTIADGGEEIFKLGAVRKWPSDNFTFKWISESYGDASKDTINKTDLAKIGSSVSCFNCHQGERPGRIMNTITDGDAQFSKPFDRKKLDVHYGAAASVFWGLAAYEYPNKTYTQGSFPQHKTNTTKKGGGFKTNEELAKDEKAYINACIDCHDFDDITHSTKPMIKEKIVDATGKTVKNIIGINMTDKRKELGCNKDGCHGEDGTEHAGKMQMNKKASITAINDIRKAFEKKFNLKFDEERKQFYYANKPNVEFSSWSNGLNPRDLMGSANNIYLFTMGDKDAYAHNPIYVKQVLWDMMDITGETFSDEAKNFMGNERPL